MGSHLQFIRLRVSGFKSFCDPTELDIGPGLTGIVGPNGCGKSNVVEALRWVMGESSAKGLRGGEMEDVIFAGSAVRAPYDLAEVALGLKRPPITGDDAAIHVLPHSEDLEISRRIGRGTGSLYRLNGREVRARDIQLLFADAGAGTKSPAIVGQGQVGFIVEAKPEERRRLLEEAAGIGGMHSRRREAELKLQATLANLERVTDQLALLADRRTALEKQAKDAERYKRLQAQIRALEAFLVGARIAAGRSALEAARRAVGSTRQALIERGETSRAAASAHAAVTAHLPGLRDAAAVAATLRARLIERHEREAEAQARKRAEVERLVADHEETTARLAALHQAIDAATHRQDTIKSTLETLASRLGELASEAPAITGDAEATLTERRRLEEEEGIAREALARVERRLEADRARHDERHMRLRAVEAELSRLDEVADDALVEAAQRKHDAAEASLAEATRQASARRGERDAAAGPLPALRQDLAEAVEVVEDARERLAKAAAATDRRRIKLDGETERRQWHERALHQAQAEIERLRHAASDLEDLQPAMAEEAEAALLEMRRRSATLEQEEATLVEQADVLRRSVDEQAQRLAELAGERVRLEVEAAALASLSEPVEASPVLDRIEVEPGYETALAAALGDDLLAGTEASATAHWCGSESPGDAVALPDGVMSLARWVAGAPMLARRLAQIGVVASADAAAALQARLAQGQRLVTPEGGVWRWDGFVRSVEADDPIRKRLAQRQRANAIALRLAELAEVEESLNNALSVGRAALAEAETRSGTCSDERQALLRTLERETHALEALLEQQERRRVEAERIATTLGRSENEVAEHQAALAVISAAIAELEADAAGDELGVAEAAFEAARRRVSAAEQSVNDGEAKLRAAEQKLTETDAVERQAHQEALAARHLLERRQGEAELRKAHRQQAIGGLVAEEARLRGELEELDGTIASGQAELADGQALCEDVVGRLAEASHRAEELRARAAAIAAEQQSAQDRRRALEEEAAHLQPDVERRRQELQSAQSREAQLAALIERERLAEGASDGGRLAAELASAKTKAEETAAELRRGEAELERCEAARREAEAALAEAQQQHALAEAEAERLAMAQAELEQETMRRLGQSIDAALAQAEATEIGATLANEPPVALEARLDKLKASRERLGAVNLRAAMECEELAGEIARLEQEEGEIREAVERLQRAIATLNREARSRLVEVFDDVDRHFRHLFQRLFGGGKAHLRLVNLDDPLNAGLELEAMPPGKKLQNIRLLSGGEKSLTALALVFAFFLTQPSPLCVLDEVDAALDDANVERFADLLEEMARETQTRFLVVTHHPLTMARMHRLFGVTMAERGVSKLVSVAFEEAERFKESA